MDKSGQQPSPTDISYFQMFCKICSKKRNEMDKKRKELNSGYGRSEKRNGFQADNVILTVASIMPDAWL